VYFPSVDFLAVYFQALCFPAVVGSEASGSPAAVRSEASGCGTAVVVTGALYAGSGLYAIELAPAGVENFRRILLDTTWPYVMPRAKLSKVLKRSIVMKAFLIVCNLRLFKKIFDYSFHETRQFIVKLPIFNLSFSLSEYKFSIFLKFWLRLGIFNHIWQI
jgi:hypothetical protein